MSDEYKKLHASLAVLGTAIAKAEDHLQKHPARYTAFVDVTEAYWEVKPWGDDDSDGMLFQGDGKTLIKLKPDDLNFEIHLYYENEQDGECDIGRLSDLPSEEKIAYAKYLPELIRIADTLVSELADKAEQYAGEIEQAIAMAASKPVREKKTKK